MNVASPIFKELSDSEFTALRKSLLRTKGSRQQEDFLEAVLSKESFLQCFPTAEVGTVDVSLVPNRLTESEFKGPPVSTEKDIYRRWSNIPPATACRTTFWAAATLHHIENERIDPVYLAANGGNLSGGRERIDSVFRVTGADRSKRLDQCVRTVLRRLGGLPEVRGNRSVYVDCPFARAWWRERFVHEASLADEDMANAVRRIFRSSQAYWEQLVDRIVFRNSTFGAENIRSAFFRSLAVSIEKNPKSQLMTTNELQRLCRRAAAHQGNRELGILSGKELDSLMRLIVDSV